MFQCVRQFADIARPVVLGQDVQRLASQHSLAGTLATLEMPVQSEPASVRECHPCGRVAAAAEPQTC